MEREPTLTAMVFDIERFAVRDGPGIRTTVFLKGCPLECGWCHNPESRSRSPQLLWDPEKCVDCHDCERVCPHSVHRWVDGQHVVKRDLCHACGACVEVCQTGALELAGRTMTVAEVAAEVRMDVPFYRRSGGGLTVSGGEPLAQPEFVLALLEASRADGIHTAVDTSGQCPWAAMERIIPHVDLFLYDLKIMDDDRHRELVGTSNERILDNLRRLDKAAQPTWIRLPLIPGQNDSDGDYRALGEFLATLEHVERIEILRYHPLAESKYARLGHGFEYAGLEPPSEEWAESRRAILMEHGLGNVVAR